MKTKTLAFMLITLVIVLPVFCSSQNRSADTTTVEHQMVAAVQKGDSLTFYRLLKTNPSLINIKEPGMEESLLHVAARNNQYGMVKILLRKGSDVNAKNRLGSIPLHLACITGSYPMVDDLIKKGSDFRLVNMRGRAPVSYVSYGLNPEIFNLFLAKDKNILDTKTKDGDNLLFTAIEAKDTKGVAFLLAKGLDVNATNQHQITPLVVALWRNNQELVSVLIKNGADVNRTGNGGNRPILIAAEDSDPEIVKLLAEAGAQINVADSAGMTALHRSARRGNSEIAAFLINKGISIDSKDQYGMTALHYAAIYGRSRIAAILLKKGANPNITDNQKNSAIYYSTYYGNESVSKELIRAGVKKPELKESALSQNLKSGEAVIHYLNHSGYAIETSGHILIFDYFQNLTPPDNLSLLNGHINMNELKGKHVIVLSSHEHGDHYDTTIWSWNSPKNKIQYVLGFRPDVNHPYTYIEPRQEITIEGVKINTIRSTDAGVGFLAEADGIVVYHPGDHVNKEPVVAEDFKSEIDYLSGLNKKVDIAFFPVAGCGFPDLNSVKVGNFYVQEKLKPGISFSMHADMEMCSGFSKEVCQRFPGKETTYAKFPGDRFRYSKDKETAYHWRAITK